MDLTRRTRAERLAMPLARDVVKDLAVEHGACIRPVQLRRTNLDTGTMDQVLVPCGHTLAAVCPACAQRAKTLRAAQCREGWHLETEPVIDPDPATGDQKWWVEKRAEAQAMHDQGASDGADAEDFDALNAELDQEINKAGYAATCSRPGRPCGAAPWPDTSVVRFEDDALPVWDEHAATYLERGVDLPRVRLLRAGPGGGKSGQENASSRRAGELC